MLLGENPAQNLHGVIYIGLLLGQCLKGVFGVNNYLIFIISN